MLDTLAGARGDDCEAVGDTRGEGGRKGDFVVAIDACTGPARGKIVFEAKNRKLSKNEALAELDGAIETRTADYAVLVVSADDKLPARTHPLREFNGDKLFVTFDPEDGSTLALEVAYGLARARVLMARAAGGGIDEGALRVELERAQGAMEDVRRIKSQLTNATTGIDAARTILDAMAVNVRGHLTAIELLLAEASAGADDGRRSELTARPTSLRAVTAAVIFDCDGVLVDTELISNTVLAGLLTQAGLPTTLEYCLRDYRGRSMSP